jgi:alpha-amylase
MINKLIKMRRLFSSVNPDFVDATFLTNHDGNRIMSELDGNMDKAKMGASLLMTLPGSPYIYYGEEIGMLGKKPDEMIREPFIWDQEGIDKGQSAWVKPQFSTAKTVTPLKDQMLDDNSLYNHYKTLIAMRRGSELMVTGEIDSTGIRRKGLVSFYRVSGNERALVLHNISKNPLEVNLGERSKDLNTVYFSTAKDLKSGEKINLPAYSTVVLTK